MGERRSSNEDPPPAAWPRESVRRSRNEENRRVHHLSRIRIQERSRSENRKTMKQLQYHALPEEVKRSQLLS
jgi:hypothetical protein